MNQILKSIKTLVDNNFTREAEILCNEYMHIMEISRVSKDYDNEVFCRQKIDKKNNGQYGYYINKDLFSIITLLFKDEKVNKKLVNSMGVNVLDLGCGEGHLVQALNLFGLFADGIEIDFRMVNNAVSKHVIFGDIFKISRNVMKKYDVIYFWEPFYDKILCKKFINHLAKITKPGQSIIYRCSGHILDFITKSKLFEFISKNNGYGTIQATYLFKRI